MRRWFLICRDADTAQVVGMWSGVRESLPIWWISTYRLTPAERRPIGHSRSTVGANVPMPGSWPRTWASERASPFRPLRLQCSSGGDARQRAGVRAGTICGVDGAGPRIASTDTRCVRKLSAACQTSAFFPVLLESNESVPVRSAILLSCSGSLVASVRPMPARSGCADLTVERW